jgi:hypothetical protein
MMFSYFNMFTTYRSYCAHAFNGLKVLGYIILFYNTTTLAYDIIIRFEGVGHDV